MTSPFTITFPSGKVACALHVRETSDIGTALEALELAHTPVLVLVGGAATLSRADHERLRPLFLTALLPAIEVAGAVVVDGGTLAGVMTLMGEVHSMHGAHFPLIGVAAGGTIVLPTAPEPNPSGIDLEPHHTHFVLVPGEHWGDEAPWIAHVTGAIAQGRASVTVLAGGGEIAYTDVATSIDAGRPVIIIGGSGGTADMLAAAVRGTGSDERSQLIASSPLLHIHDLTDPPAALAQKIDKYLS